MDTSRRDFNPSQKSTGFSPKDECYVGFSAREGASAFRPRGSTNTILIAALGMFYFLFAFSLFQNIAYPLLWNDEAETAMFARRILEYGYPKVHDGKNVVYLLNPSIELGVKKGMDAYIGLTWGQYYLAALGEIFAEKVGDIYKKTALLRIPFALIGLLGIIIMALSVLGLYKKKLTFMLSFLVSFAFLELLSVSLVLHLREVRCYALAIFLSAYLFYIYIKRRFFSEISFTAYTFLFPLFLTLLFNTFPPASAAFAITIFLYECIEFLKKKELKGLLTNLSPLFISLIPIFFCAAFFETLRISKEFAKAIPGGFSFQLAHIIRIADFFQKYEFLNLVLAVKIILVLMLVRFRKLKTETDEGLRVSNFFSLFFIVYLFVVSRIPLRFIFQRYFILLEPVLILVLLLDIFIVFDLLARVDARRLRRQIGGFFSILICSLFLLCGANKIDGIKNHAYELFHQYRGPLDFAIPFIKTHYEKPENLVIATNYEECAYMYYLGARTTIGFMRNNLKEDLKIEPDIIIFRKNWGANPEIFNFFLQKGGYAKIAFPVFDYPFNNIPETDSVVPPHLFKTLLAESESSSLDIYVRK